MGWLRDRLDTGDMLVTPGGYDAMSARVIESHGFEALYCGGYAGIASSWGLPDLGLVGFAEMCSLYRRIRSSSTLPMIVDADTGYGGPLNLARTIAEYAAMGITALQLEDQVDPKRCGHVAGKEVLPVDEAERRIRIAVEMSREHGLDVIARTDALEPHGVDAAIDRGNRFLDLGATAVLVDAPRTVGEIELIAEQIRGHVVFNAADTGRTPRLTIQELDQLGYSMVFFPIELLASAVAAVRSALSSLQRTGHPGATPRASFSELGEALGMGEMITWERTISDDRPSLGGQPSAGVPARLRKTCHDHGVNGRHDHTDSTTGKES